MKNTAVEWLELNMETLLMDGYKFNSEEAYNLYDQAKEMEKQQQGYSEEEVKNIMAETWIQCVGNDGNNFKKLRDKILEQFKNK